MTAKILIVEDDFANQQVASLFIKKFGYEYDVAVNGKIAVEKTLTISYDLILMDCQMPVMDGFEATAKIIEFENINNQKHIPIIALTANSLHGDKEKCIAAGMDDYLSKPVSQKDFAKIVSKWLKYKKTST